MIPLDLLGADARFHHLGLAVTSIHEACPAATSIHDPIQRVRVAFVMLQGLPVELMEPAGDDSPIVNSLQKGARLLHLCYEVADLAAALAACRRHGFHPIAGPAPAAAFDQRRIAWVFSRQYGVIELLERAKNEK